MKINELMAMQKELDDFIIKEKKLEEKSQRDMINALFCATYSEILEVCETPQESMAEELTDVLHFVLAIGYRLGLNDVMAIDMTEIESNPRGIDTYSLFRKTCNLMDQTKAFKFWSNKEPASTYILSKYYFSLFKELWNALRSKLTTDDAVIIEYKKKYEINIQRQKSGY